MEPELNLITIRDEVFRKIGRNLLSFQKIEHMLKYLITNGRMSGYMSELVENQERRSASIHKQTMGQLVGQFMDNTYQGLEESGQTLDIDIVASFSMLNDLEAFQKSVFFLYKTNFFEVSSTTCS